MLRLLGFWWENVKECWWRESEWDYEKAKRLWDFLMGSTTDD